MKITHISPPSAGHTLHLVEFGPANSCEQDLLQLPHHAQLQHVGRKRETEHLAGRVVAVYVLWEYGYKCVPAIGELRQPIWSAEVYGSISHRGTTALVVVSRQPIDIDIEKTFSVQTARELTDNIITPAEHKRFADCGLALSLALILAFPAKEGTFKASEIQADAGFPDYQIVSWNKQQVIIHRENEMSAVHRQIREKIVTTLCQYD